jgi:capsular polysaccharide biosynthesis protein
VRGKFENCKIRSRKENGENINLVVACASGIMLSNVQFFLKVIDDDTISREFQGMPEMEVKYHRCRI